MTWSDSLPVSSPSTISCVWVSHISLSAFCFLFILVWGEESCVQILHL